VIVLVIVLVFFAQHHFIEDARTPRNLIQTGFRAPQFYDSNRE
jgi:hypothetical protein